MQPARLRGHRFAPPLDRRPLGREHGPGPLAGGRDERSSAPSFCLCQNPRRPGAFQHGRDQPVRVRVDALSEVHDLDSVDEHGEQHEVGAPRPAGEERLKALNPALRADAEIVDHAGGTVEGDIGKGGSVLHRVGHLWRSGDVDRLAGPRAGADPDPFSVGRQVLDETSVRPPAGSARDEETVGVDVQTPGREVDEVRSARHARGSTRSHLGAGCAAPAGLPRSAGSARVPRVGGRRRPGCWGSRVSSHCPSRYIFSYH